jgi:hypothetical protein
MGIPKPFPPPAGAAVHRDARRAAPTHPSITAPRTHPQVSPRTQWLVANDWVRAWIFGRNLSDI